MVFTVDGENGKAAITTQVMVIVTSPRYNSVSVKHCPVLRERSSRNKFEYKLRYFAYFSRKYLDGDVNELHCCEIFH